MRRTEVDGLASGEVREPDRDTASVDDTPNRSGTSRPRRSNVNGLVLRANWREHLPAQVPVRDRVAAWVGKYPVLGEIAADLRRGDVRKVFWERPSRQATELWSRRPSSERVRAVLVERRVLIAGVVVVAVLVASDGQFGGLVDRPLAPGEAQRVAIAYPPQIPPNPQSVRRLLVAIDNGEKRREAAVVAAAARATLERAKAEAAAASSGQWQDWMGERAPVVPGVMVPGSSTPSTGGFSLPAKGLFTSGFGSRWGTMHRGIDIAGPIGSPIYAVADGTVVEAGPAQGFGLWVRIRHDDGTISIYGHMYDFFVSPGERVPAGMQIARIGNRGDSTGPHLHFEIVQNGQHVDPQAWLARHGLSLT
ncbi:M23 family metallopeptidase [Nocardia sp. JW2]|uniref:M23 family metallopeptidase n=1 Tax=Nocardia sp. JW2 TaxID=3450738 RepID=UPI003F442297